jgi:hypothetical protein
MKGMKVRPVTTGFLDVRDAPVFEGALVGGCLLNVYGIWG